MVMPGRSINLSCASLDLLGVFESHTIVQVLSPILSPVTDNLNQWKGEMIVEKISTKYMKLAGPGIELGTEFVT